MQPAGQTDRAAALKAPVCLFGGRFLFDSAWFGVFGVLVRVKGPRRRFRVVPWSCFSIGRSGRLAARRCASSRRRSR